MKSFLHIFKIISMKNSFIIIVMCLAIFFSCNKSSISIDSVDVYVAGNDLIGNNVANTGKMVMLSR